MSITNTEPKKSCENFKHTWVFFSLIKLIYSQLFFIPSSWLPFPFKTNSVWIPVWFWSHYFLGQRFPSLIYFALIFLIMAISSSYHLGKTQVGKKNVLEKSYSEAYIFVNYLISFRFRCFYLNKTLIVSFRFQNSMKKTSEVVFWDKFILNRSLKELFLETISKNYLWRANQPKLQTQFISKEA